MNYAVKTHGHTQWRDGKPKQSPTYRSWVHMMCRCRPEYGDVALHYQKRGITVCDRWRVFDNFLADMGVRPDKLTLERIDNDGNYEPGNCRWATRREQSNNTSSNVRFDYKGKSYTVAELARLSGLSKHTIRYRLQLSDRWTVEEAMTEPSSHGNKYLHRPSPQSRGRC